MSVFWSNSSKKTQEIAFFVSKKYFESCSLLVFLLDGELGSGKTEFVKGVAKSLGFKTSQIKSPSFIIINELSNKNFKLVHVDLYRITQESANRMIFDLVEELNFKRKVVLCIEWASKLTTQLIEKFKNFENSKILKVNFEIIDSKRKISITNQ